MLAWEKWINYFWLQEWLHIILVRRHSFTVIWECLYKEYFLQEYFGLYSFNSLFNKYIFSSVQFSCSVVSNSLWPHELQHARPPYLTNSWSLPKLMSIELVIPSNHLILCRPLLPPFIFPNIRVFSSESALRIRWSKYWSFSFNISPSNEHWDWSPLGWTGWISLQPKGLSRVFSNTTVQKHQFFGAQLSSQSNSHIHTWPLEKP